jgi:hypothetical protein
MPVFLDTNKAISRHSKTKQHLCRQKCSRKPRHSPRMPPRTIATISLLARDNRGYFNRGPSTRTAPVWSQISRPSTREKQYLEAPPEPTEKPEDSRESEEVSSSRDELPSDIPERSQFPEQESPEEEQPVNPGYFLEIKEIHLKSERS